MVFIIDNNDAIKKAKEIKKHGGVGKIYVGLSNFPQDPLAKSIQKSTELIKRLNSKRVWDFFCKLAFYDIIKRIYIIAALFNKYYIESTKDIFILCSNWSFTGMKYQLKCYKPNLQIFS